MEAALAASIQAKDFAREELELAIKFEIEAVIEVKYRCVDFGNLKRLLHWTASTIEVFKKLATVSLELNASKTREDSIDEALKVSCNEVADVRAITDKQNGRLDFANDTKV